MDLFRQIGLLITSIHQKQQTANNQLVEQFSALKINDQSINDRTIHDMNPQCENAQNKKNVEQKNQQAKDNQSDDDYINYSYLGFFDAIFTKVIHKNQKAFKQLANKIQAVQVDYQEQKLIPSFYQSKSVEVKKDIKEIKQPCNLYTVQHHSINLNTIKPNHILSNAIPHPFAQSSSSFCKKNQKLNIQKNSIAQQTSLNHPLSRQRQSKSRRTIRLAKNYPKKPQNNPQQAQQKTAKQILTQLQQLHRKKSIQKQKQKQTNKSLNIRTKVIKITAQATLQARQKRQKQAKIKMLNNIQFLEYIKKPNKKQNVVQKEFKNDLKQVVKLMSNKRIKLINREGFDEKYSPTGYGKNIKQDMFVNKEPRRQRKKLITNHDQDDISLLKPSSSSIFRNDSLSNRKKLPPVQTKHLIKPKPYSLYNIYKKHNQVFMNKPLLEQ